MVTIKKEGEIEITIPDSDLETKVDKELEKVEDVEKAASPPTIEMVIARLDKLTSFVNELGDTVKTLKQAPKPPKKDEKEKEKDDKKEEKAIETPAEKVVEEPVEKKEEIDVVALITEIVEKKVGEKIGEQPIQKRSTAPAEPQTFKTPMEIPAEILAKADPESILRMGGFTTKRR